MCYSKLKYTIMKRDEMSGKEADELIKLARKDLYERLENPDEFDSAYDICADWFGLEPDYIMDLL